MRYVIGIDGGGTKTEAVIMNLSGEIAGSFEVGATNPNAVSYDVARGNLYRLLDCCFNDAGMAAADCLAVSLGLSGVDSAEEREKIAASLREYGDRHGCSCDILIHNDAEIALMAALGRNRGIIAISGTGAIVFGVAPDGIRYRTGGWGHILGDQGSGYDIGLSVLQTVMRSYDGVCPETALTGLVLEKHGFSSPEQLRTYIYQPHIQKANIAEYAHLCIRAAETMQDAAARQIVEKAARELAALTNALRGKHPYFADAPVAATGSIFKHSELFRDTYRRCLNEWNEQRRLDRRTDVAISERKPAHGAALLALQAAAR